MWLGIFFHFLVLGHTFTNLHLQVCSFKFTSILTQFNYSYNVYTLVKCSEEHSGPKIASYTQTMRERTERGSFPCLPLSFSSQSLQRDEPLVQAPCWFLTGGDTSWGELCERALSHGNPMWEVVTLFSSSSSIPVAFPDL